MDFQLITNYDVTEIIKFLDENPQIWDKSPNLGIDNSPNYKSINKEENQGLSITLDKIVRDLISRFNKDPEQVSITLLPAGEDIANHLDEVGALRRFHIPIKTNDQVIFYCGDSAINMKVGECWEFNYKQWHRVVNGGTTDRIHLMIDLNNE